MSILRYQQLFFESKINKNSKQNYFFGIRNTCCRYAKQWFCTGHISHFGFCGVQTVAPNSIRL